MASKYGGQGANAAVKGYQQGYKFQQDSETAMQEAQLRSEKIKSAGMDNELMKMAVDDVRVKQQEEIKTLQKAQTTTNSTIVKSDINNITLQSNSKDREQYIGTLQTKFKTNPEIYKMLGIKNPQTMSILNPRDSKDREWMESTLIKEGLKVEDYGDNWDAMITETMDAYPALKADGAIVDLNGLSAATGSAVMATPQYNKIMEKNRKELQARWDRNMQNTENAMTADLGGKGAGGDGYVERPDKPLENPTEAVFEARNKAFNEGTADIEKTSQTDKAGRTDLARLKDKEGFRAKAYKDQEGYDTIGYGHKILPNEKHLLNKELSKEEAHELLMQDAKGHEDKFLAKEPWIKDLDPKAQEALLDMSYNMGPNWLDKFPNTKKALQAGDMEGAAKGILDSKYAKQVGKRAQENADLLRGGGGTVTQQITNEISSSGDNGQPLNDMRMRKIYALLGRNYPKDPNEPTAKMKTFDFLSEKVGEKQAMEAVFGSTGSSGRMEKAIKFLRTLEPGTKEYEAQENYIKKLGRSGTASEQDFKDWREELKDPNITPERQAELEEKISDAKKTASEQTSEAKVANRKQAHGLASGQANNVAKAVESGVRIDAKGESDLREAQRIQQEYAPSKVKEADEKIKKDMRANQEAGNEIAYALNSLEEGGDLEDAEQGILDNTVQWVMTKVTDDKVPKKYRDEMKANIKKDSILGYLQATLIKAMSGTAASEAEVQRLQKVMQGNNWDQIGPLKTALKSFYDGLGRRQNTKNNQLNASPYDGYNLSMMDKVDEAKGEDKPVTHRGKEVKRTGTMNGKRVVEYTDGTTEVL